MTENKNDGKDNKENPYDTIPEKVPMNYWDNTDMRNYYKKIRDKGLSSLEKFDKEFADKNKKT